MKKIALIMALTLTMLTGCSGHDVEPEQSSIANKYIDLVVIYENLSQQTEVMYDKNTGVMYLCKYGQSSSFMIPIYNADGTLKLYEEK
jgi:hypothetical protein